MIAIIDYGVGNLFSLKSSLEYLGLEAKITADEQEIRSADKIILPGVGAFGDAIKKLESTNLIPVIKEEIKKKPLLGICLGMQLLLDKSYEFGEYNGLGLIPGEVVPFDIPKEYKVPHMGWNSLDITQKDCALLKNTKDGEYVYYVHSYYAKTEPKYIAATSNYCIDVPGVIFNGNVYGAQFHPEKSGEVGLKILKAFGEIK